MFFEAVLDLCRQSPQGHTSRRIEDLSAAVFRHFEDNACLNERMCGGEAPFQHDGSARSQHPLGVPPACPVHLPVSADNQSQREETFDIDS